jgi:plasmid stabilization system protein ParE
MVTKITKAVRTASQNPLLGQVVAEFSDNDIRERLIQKYRLVYRVRTDAIVILAIIHGARDAGAIHLEN